MKKFITILIVLILGLTASVCSAQGLMVIVDKINNVEERIDQVNATLNSEIDKLKVSVSGLKASGGAGSTKSLNALQTQVNALSAELVSVKSLLAASQKQQQVAYADLYLQISQLGREIANFQTSSSHEPPQYAGLEAPVVFKHHESGSVLDARTRLEENGVSFELVYTGEMSSNISGGLEQRSVYLENGDLVLSIDAEKLIGWTGASFSFYTLGDGGGSPSENVGDIQGVSNIESDETWKLYEAWYQQEFLGGRLSFLTGLYDLNSEFDVTETAGLFLSSSFGIGPDFSQSGENGPSIFPTTSLAFRTKVQISNAFYFQNAIFDGVPGDPEKPSGTHIKFDDGDGVLVASEVGFVTGTGENSDSPYSKFALGSWFYTAKYDDVLDVDGQGDPVRRSGNKGLYLIGEQTVYREKDPSQGLAIFARIGFANTKVNQIGSYFGGGLVFSGLIPGRDEDQLGFAVAAAFNGSKYKQAQLDAGNGVESGEVTLELSYNSQILPQLSIHPDLQYVINPSGDPEIKNALLFTTRFELAF